MLAEGFQQTLLLQLVEVVIGEAVLGLVELGGRRVGDRPVCWPEWAAAVPVAAAGLARRRQFLTLHAHQADEDFVRFHLLLVVLVAIDDRQTPALGIQTEDVLELVDAEDAGWPAKETI